MLKVRAIVTDFFNAKRTQFDPAVAPATGKKISQVPLIRIFGPLVHGDGDKNEAEIRACVYVHGVFPYFYVRMKEGTVSDDNDEGDCLEYAHEFAQDLESQLIENMPSVDADIPRLYDVRPVRRKWFYGGKIQQEETFLKVSLLKTQFATPAVELLRNGEVFDTKYDICESHIPYSLHFYADNNIYGMDVVKFSQIEHVRRGTISGDFNVRLQRSAGATVGFGLSLRPQSICPFECDAMADNIENRRDLAASNMPLEGATPSDTFVPSLLQIRKETMDILLSQSQQVQSIMSVPAPVSGSGSTLLSLSKSKTQDGCENDGEGEWEDQYWAEQLLRYMEREKQAIKRGKEYGKMKYVHKSEEEEDEDEVQASQPQLLSLNGDQSLSDTGVLVSVVQWVEKATTGCSHSYDDIDLDPDRFENQSVQSESESKDEDVHNVIDEWTQIGAVNFGADDDEDGDSDGDGDRGGGIADHSLPKRQKTLSSVVQDGDEEDQDPVLLRKNLLKRRNAALKLRANIETETEYKLPVEEEEPDLSMIVTQPDDDSIRRRYYDIVADGGDGEEEGGNDGSAVTVTAAYTPFNPPPDPISIEARADRISWTNATGDDTKVFYSKRSDLPEKPVFHFAGKPMRVPHLLDPTGIPFFSPPMPDDLSVEWKIYHKYQLKNGRMALQNLLAARKLEEEARAANAASKYQVWTPIVGPPLPRFRLTTSESASTSRNTNTNTREMDTKTKVMHRHQERHELSQISAMTPSSSNPAKKHGLLVSPTRLVKKNANVNVNAHRSDDQRVTLLFIEVQARTRDDLYPDVSCDPVICISYCVRHDNDGEGDDGGGGGESGVLEIENPSDPDLDHTHEIALMNRWIDLVRKVDPEIIGSFDTVTSLGYLLDRGKAIGMDLLTHLHKAPSNMGRFNDTSTSISIVGRVIMNLWRILRHEIPTLRDSSFHSAVYHILHRRFPKYTNKDLTSWHCSLAGNLRNRALTHCLSRAMLCTDIVQSLDLIRKTSELARVYGIDFTSVLSRGSQYRVEGMLKRIAKTQNYVLFSAPPRSVASQKAPEAIPLVMEPRTGFYGSRDPVAVLDFRSLYPSVVIGHNICYSTALGRVDAEPGSDQIFGCSTLNLPPGSISALNESGDISVAPNGMMYMSKRVRHGVLPRLLEEILETRIAVKKKMAEVKTTNKQLYHKLDARQYGLKMIANVTYGYTSAGFSGRMPCVDIADSIVAWGRQSLERSIRMIESTEKWHAKVIYADTDSVFVLLPNRSKEEAFRISREISRVVSSMFPAPMELEFEKVYLGCILSTKKRYVGMKYEHEKQEKPVFDAKGIETIRRDQCLSTAKIVEKCLTLLFNSSDASSVKSYLEAQLARIMQERVSIFDFIFSKEVRLGTYSNRAPPPPAAVVATKKMLKDPRAAPRHGQRVSYVVVSGAPGSRLVDLVVSPEELATDPTLRLNSTYYITKQILPALERLLAPIGIDVNHWYSRMAKLSIPVRYRYRLRGGDGVGGGGGKRTIDRYYGSNQCEICGVTSSVTANQDACLCERCIVQPQATSYILIARRSIAESKNWNVGTLCVACQGGCIQGGSNRPAECTAISCPIFYERQKYY